MSGTPAILGGAPTRTTELPVARPTLHSEAGMLREFQDVLESGMLTNGRHVSRFERDVADFVGVENVIAVSNCTTGLLMLLKCLGRTGDCVLPSFTFMATAHAAAWAGLRPAWADSGPRTCTIDPASARDLVDRRTAVLVGVHTFGSPCDTAELEQVAAEHEVPFIVDAAHAFGGRYPDGSRVGSAALAEVFSLSPTKPLTTGEGGLITTNDAALATELRTAREYGNPGDYDSRFAGLNGRLTEFAALLGLHNLPRLPAVLDSRRTLAARYRDRLSGIPGIRFQQTTGEPTFKDLVVLVDREEFGIDRDQLALSLHAERVSTRKYFDPPLHTQTAYRGEAAAPHLPHTALLSATALTLPLFAHMSTTEVDQVCDAVEVIAENSAAIAARLETDEDAARKEIPAP